MDSFNDIDVSQAILDAYHAKVRGALRSDVAIVGAGPSGLVSAWRLAAAGHRVVVLEKRLSPGGGVWGGSMGMNEVAIQPEAVGILDEAGVRHRSSGPVHVADAMELACGLCVHALRAGAVLLNVTFAEDLCIRGGRVVGVVANRTRLAEGLPIDPMTFAARVCVDATGHEAALARCLLRRGLLAGHPDRLPGEGPMDAAAGERFVVEHVTELYPGLWTTGMSVCAAVGGPRMGPIFGGMLLSGQKLAAAVHAALHDAPATAASDE